MTTIITPAKFTPGQIMITQGAIAKVPPKEAILGLVRHVAGDWGDLDEHDRRENEAALQHDFRLLSRYVTVDGTAFYVITEHDRSYTIILLPEEYC